MEITIDDSVLMEQPKRCDVHFRCEESDTIADDHEIDSLHVLTDGDKPGDKEIENQARVVPKINNRCLIG